MAASLATGSALQAAATLMQPTKLTVSRNSIQLRPSHVSKAFGFEPATSRMTCSLQEDVKEFAEKCVDATKIAAVALATSALVVSGANAEGVPKRLTFDEIQSKTYMEVKGTGTANQCPTIDSGIEKFPFKAGKYNVKKLCLEPTSFTVKAESLNKKSAPDFQKTKLMTRLTYTLDEIEGPLEVSPDGSVKFVEKDGIDYAAVTVQLPGGERVPFLFTVKQLVASGTPEKFGGQFLVPAYRGSSFLDPKGRGGSTGYDNAVALPAGGRGDEEELAKENNKDVSSSVGNINLSVSKTKPETGEVIGVFESVQPSDTDLGSKAPKEVKIQGIWHIHVVPETWFLHTEDTHIFPNMAASLATGSALQAAATLMQPTKLTVSRNSIQLRPSHVSKAFGFEPATSRMTCSLQEDVKEFAEKCVDATKIAAVALATSALVVSGANAEGVPKRLTFDEIQSKTYMEVKGTGTANQCPTIDSGIEKFPFKAGKYNVKKLCLEPTSFTVKAESLNKKSAPDFQKTKLMTRLTYTLDEIEGPLEVSPDGSVKFVEKDGIDYAAVTVQLPGGERVPFLFTVKQLVASGTPEKFGGQFLVPAYRGSSFLDPKGRGGSTGYDNAVALPAGGRGDEEELAKENNKDVSSSVGNINLSVSKTKPETGEVIGVFESVQPSDTDLGSKAPKEVKIQGIWYAQIENA
eukprot:Gb_39017 [translate_table: standard]